jgi:RNA polymerase sigma-70 factor, ECF subfamily
MAWNGTDAELLELARRGDKAAVAAAVYDLFTADVNRLVWRVLGADPDHDDVVHQVFINLVLGVGKLRDPGALKVWMASVCVKTVRSEIRRRRIRRFFTASSGQAHRVAGPVPDHEARDLLEKTYAILDALPTQERMAFALRHFDELALGEVAEACSCSLATIKRRLKKAETRFARLAERQPALAERLRRGGLGEDQVQGSGYSALSGRERA